MTAVFTGAGVGSGAGAGAGVGAGAGFSTGFCAVVDFASSLVTGFDSSFADDSVDLVEDADFVVDVAVLDKEAVFTILGSCFSVGADFGLCALEYVDAPITMAKSAAVADKASDLLWYKVSSFRCCDTALTH